MSDFDDDDLDMDDTGFDDFEDDQNEGGNTLGDMWRNNPAFKIIAVIVVVVILIFVFRMLSSSSETVGLSNIPESPSVAATPGGEGASQAYVEAVVDENSRRFEEAITTGGSVIPTPIDPRTPVLSIAPEEDTEEDPLDRWRRLQEQRANLAAIAPSVPQETPEQVAQRIEAIQSLSDIMAAQMSTILEDQSEVLISSQTFTDPSYLSELYPEEDMVADGENGDDPNGAEINDITLLPAGEIEYAQLITQANSDVPGPILAEIAGGPLSGARIIGTFAPVRELLTLSFTSIVLDGVTYPINAVALDPNTTVPGIATDVNRHYFRRMFLPAAAAFVQGFASAIAQTGRTDITIEGQTTVAETEEADNDEQVATGVEEAGTALNTIINEMNAQLVTTIIVDAGTPLGILFTEPVTIPDPNAVTQ